MVVPNGWTIKPIEQIMRIRKERINPQALINTRCIELEHIEPISGRLLGWIESNNQRSLKAVFTAGDVLFGKLRPYLRKYCYPSFDGICSTEFWVLTAFDNSVDNSYIYYIVQTNRFLETANSTTGTKMPRADWSLMKEVSFSIPLSLTEQRDIAAVLSDADAYITALEKLIAKKRNLKQGAMQVLLTGKRRLPGFDGEWDTLNLASNSTLKARIGWQGLTTAEYLDEGYSYLITGTDFSNGKIAWSSCHYVDKSRYNQDTNIQVCNGDVLITKDGTIGKVAIVNGLTKKATLNSGVYVVRPKNDAYDRTYIYYVLLSQIFADFLAKLAAGSTINHLYQKDFVNFEFEAPAAIAEQTAIATVLSDMDAEIDTLTAKIEKARRIKQGMMGELLTGRIRLIEEDTENG